jgi:hypothetical protein
MDLNYLYHRHQVSLAAASAALSAEARASHRGLAAAYSASIARSQAGTGGFALVCSRVS